MAKIKVKSHSGSKKRFRMTGTGKVKAARPYRRHLLTKKSAKRKRQLRSPLYIKSCDIKHITEVLPYL